MKDKYTLDSDAAVMELVLDLKGAGWFVNAGFGKDPKEPEAEAVWRCKATDPEKVRASVAFNSTDVVIPLADQVKVFTASEYELNQSIFGGGN